MQKILYNLIGGILGVLIIAACFKQPGYKFVKEMLEGNYKTIKNNPHATIDQRFEAKLGTTYRACQYIRQNTPDTAVLLWPDNDDFCPKGVNSGFASEMGNKMYGLRFLHPRRLIMKKELPELQNKDIITHVVVVHDSCREYLPYPLAGHIEFAVLPMDKYQLSSK